MCILLLLFLNENENDTDQGLHIISNIFWTDKLIESNTS